MMTQLEDRKLVTGKWHEFAVGEELSRERHYRRTAKGEAELIGDTEEMSGMKPKKRAKT